MSWFARSRETTQELFALRRNGYSGPFFNGSMLLLMGLWLLAPWSDSFESSISYSFMADIASELAWGVFLVFTSLVIVVSALGRKPREVALGALLAAGAWFALFCSFAIGNPDSVTVPMTMVMFLRSLSLHQEFRFHFDPVTGVAYDHQCRLEHPKSEMYPDRSSDEEGPL